MELFEDYSRNLITQQLPRRGKSGGEEWKRRAKEKSGGKEWWRKVVEKSGGEKWRRRVEEKSGGQSVFWISPSFLAHCIMNHHLYHPVTSFLPCLYSIPRVCPGIPQDIPQIFSSFITSFTHVVILQPLFSMFSSVLCQESSE